MGLFVPFFSVNAATFDNGNIITDFDMQNNKAMNVLQIKAFLDRKSGTLHNYSALDVNGVMRTASEIIYNAAQEHKISPLYLLVMLQKEMSLVEDSTPKQSQYDWAMGYGICDICSPTDPKVLLLKGFGTQVDRAAGSMRWYFDNASNGWLKRAGKSYVVDGHNVFMQNQATANLYNYTPHIHGNYLFWKIWNQWFSQKYPDGTLLQAENEPGVWLLQNGLRRPFHSKVALMSRFNLDQIIIITSSELEKYEIGLPIKFPNYSILDSGSDVYLLVDDALRRFESAEVLRTIGYNPEEFEPITAAEVAAYPQGTPITIESAYPAGALLQDNSTGGVYFVQDGKKYPIVHKDIMMINYPDYTLSAVTPEELAKYERLESVKIKDGTIIKATNSASVFFVSNGKKRPISSGEVYESLKYKWDNVYEVDKRAIGNLPLGSYIDLDYKQ